MNKNTHRLTSDGIKNDPHKFSKILIILIFSALSIARTIYTEDDNDPSTRPFHLQKLSRYSLLLSKGDFPSLKSNFIIFRPKFPPKHLNSMNFFQILLILSGNIELNPGPTTPCPIDPCGICGLTTDDSPAVECEQCEIWFHKKCMTMCTYNFDRLQNCSWICCTCGLPNFSSGLFDSFDFSTLSQNPFSNLSDTSSSNSLQNSPDYSQTPTKNPIPVSASTPNHSKGQHPKRDPYSGLTHLVINFQSLWNKRVELSNLAIETRSDIIIGTETWLIPESQTGGHKDSELLLPEYDIFRRDRPSTGGGVLIAVKKDLECIELTKSKDTETIFCTIKRKGKRPLIIGSVYRAPNLDLDTCTKIASETYNIVDKNRNAVFWIGGDFNLPDINWKNQDITGNRYPQLINKIFLEMAQDLGLTQVIDVPTRGTSFLDLLFSNKPDLVKKVDLLAGLGDHEAVKVEIRLSIIRKKPTKRRIQLWNRVDAIKMKIDVEKFRSNFLDNFTCKNNVNDIWNHIKKEITSLIEKHVPSKMTSSKVHQPWINTETKRLIRKKNRWLQKAKKSNSPHFWKTYKKIKSHTQKICRQTHDEYLHSIFSEDKSNKKLWSYIKSRKQQNVGIPDLTSENNTPINDPTEKANLIRKQFDSVLSNPFPTIHHDFDENERLPTINPIQITSFGIQKLLSNINPNKAVGPDNVPGKFLKLFASEMADTYQVLFQASLDQGQVPPDWKTANIVPLYKKGNKSLPENYRPVSLTSQTCKLLEHVVYSNFMKQFLRYNVLDDAQHGFRKQRSCTSQLITTIDDYAVALKNQQQIDAILLDFSKAFDKVDHEGLLLKLEHLGIRGPLLEWTRSFLINRTQKVVVDGMESTPSNVLSGVPQGTVLGPLFFLVYINDISKGLSKDTKIRLFADDSLLYRTIKNPSDTAILQKDLDTLQLWEKKWKMEFHPGKCQLLRITKKIKPIIATYNIHETPLSETDSAKYLGVVIDPKLSWRNQYTNTIKKSNNTLAFLKRNLSNAPTFVKEKCYTTLVRTQAEYACVVWDPCYKNHTEDIEKIQKRGARFVTNNYKMETGNTQINIEKLGWQSLEERRLQIKLKTFQKGRLKALDIPINHLAFNERQSPRLNGDGPTYQIPTSKINSYIYSFYPRTSLLWNNLPPEVRTCTNLEHFTEKVNTIDLISIKRSLEEKTKF